MFHLVRYPVLVLALAVAVTGCKSTPGSDGSPPESAADFLASAGSAADAGEFDRAHRLYETILDRFPDSREAGAAAWEVAEMSYRMEEWRDAKEEYEDYHESQPLGHLSELEERMYEIGRRLYEQGRGGWLDLGIFASTASARSAMTFVADELSSGSRSDDALLFLGKTSILGGKYEEAADYFNLLLEKHPESEWAFEARFYVGWAYWLVNRGAPYDLRSLLQARDAFDDYVRRVEGDPARRTEYTERIAEARENLVEINATLAEKDVLIGRWYLSQERPESARFYLDRASREYPDTEAGAEARELLMEAGAGASGTGASGTGASGTGN